MRIETVKLVWEMEFSRLVTETYGRPYQLQQQEPMMSQNTIVSVTVPAELDDFGDESFPSLEEWSSAWVSDPVESDGRLQWSFDDELFWHREYYPRLQAVLNDLHSRGLLDAGDYVIHAWW